MRKALTLLALLLCTAISSRSQSVIVNLNTGLNTIQYNSTPSTTATVFQLNFPTNTLYFSLLAQPHTASAITSNLQITVNSANNTSISGSSGISFGLTCQIGGGGTGNPVSVNLSTLTTILQSGSAAAGVASCPVAVSFGAQLSVSATASGGPAYDLFCVVTTGILNANSTFQASGGLAPGSSGATSAPVLVGGIDNTGIVRTLGVTNQNGMLPMLFALTVPNGSTITPSAYARADGTQGAAVNLPLMSNGSGFDYMFDCPNSSVFSVVSTTTQIVAAIAAQKIKICSFSLNPATTTAGSVDLVQGTGANCGTGTTTLTGTYTLPAVAVVNAASMSMTPAGAIVLPTNTALCVRTVTSTVNGFVTWAQFQ